MHLYHLDMNANNKLIKRMNDPSRDMGSKKISIKVGCIVTDPEYTVPKSN